MRVRAISCAPRTTRSVTFREGCPPRGEMTPPMRLEEVSMPASICSGVERESSSENSFSVAKRVENTRRQLARMVRVIACSFC